MSRVFLVCWATVCLGFAASVQAKVYEVTDFTPSYELPGASFTDASVTDGKWRVARDGWNNPEGPYLLATAETISEPLGLSLNVPNRTYDVYVRMNKHGYGIATQISLTSPDELSYYFYCPIKTRAS